MDMIRKKRLGIGGIEGQKLQGFAKAALDELKGKIPKIHPMEMKIHELKHFKLSNMWAIFKIADFERTASDYHIDDIRLSIVNNTFPDSFVRGFIDKKGFKVILDGQHRLKALWFLAKYYGLEYYDLYFIEYSEANARENYRSLNSGKTLNMKNVLKSYDEQQHPFFVELKDILSHDDNTREWSFAEALGALTYAKTGNRSMGRRRVEKMFECVTGDDIKFVREYVKALTLTMPQKTRGTQYRPAFSKPCFAVSYRYKLNYLEITNLIYYGLGHELIEAHLDINSKAGYEELVRLFTDGLPKGVLE